MSSILLPPNGLPDLLPFPALSFDRELAVLSINKRARDIFQQLDRTLNNLLLSDLLPDDVCGMLVSELAMLESDTIPDTSQLVWKTGNTIYKLEFAHLSSIEPAEFLLQFVDISMVSTNIDVPIDSVVSHIASLSDDLVICFDENLKIGWFNPVAEKQFGRLSDNPHVSILNLFSYPDEYKLSHLLQEFMLDDSCVVKIFHTETCYINSKQGDDAEVRMSVAKWQVAGKVSCILFLNDISLQLSSLEPVSETLAQLAEAEKIGGTGSFLLDDRGRLSCSFNCQSMLGLDGYSELFDIEILLGKVSEEFRGRLENKLQCLVNGTEEVVNERLNLVGENEKTFDVIVQKIDQFYLNGKTVFIGVIKDVTDTVQSSRNLMLLQQQLQQAQKMESIGQLTGGIAHDFNNILASILGYSGLALNGLDTDSDVHGYVQEVSSAGHRARELISQMLEFSRTRARQPEVMNLSPSLEHSLTMLKSMLPSSTRLHYHGIDESDLSGGVMGSDIQIQQLVINLIVNANDSIKGAGNILISISQRYIPALSCSACTINYSGNYRVIKVRDDGEGMSPDVLLHIFSPFFSTKSEGKGSGLGLSIVNRIMHEHGGHIHVSSTEGEGTCFELFFPVVEDDSGHELIDIAGRRLNILVVDDEITVLTYLREILELNEFRVYVAHSVSEAITVIDDNSIDIVLTDYAMPGQTGEKLIKYVRNNHPNIPCLLCTGSAGCSQSVREIADSVLEKPFRSTVLLEKINQLHSMREA